MANDPVKTESYAVLDDSGQPTGEIVSSPPVRGIQLDPPNAAADAGLVLANTEAVRIAAGDARPTSQVLGTAGVVRADGAVTVEGGPVVEGGETSK